MIKENTFESGDWSVNVAYEDEYEYFSITKAGYEEDSEVGSMKFGDGVVSELDEVIKLLQQGQQWLKGNKQ